MRIYTLFSVRMDGTVLITLIQPKMLLSSDTAYKAQGCSVVLHVVESSDRTMMSETLKIL